MQVNSSTHISFPAHTLPPLRKASNNLTENMFSTRLYNLRINMELSLNMVENASLKFSQELCHHSDQQKCVISCIICVILNLPFLETLTPHWTFFFFLEIVIKKHHQRLIRMDTQTFTSCSVIV